MGISLGLASRNCGRPHAIETAHLRLDLLPPELQRD
jgi:hypothetical protein